MHVEGRDAVALGLTKKVLILVAIPVVFELILVGVLLNLINSVENARAKAAHANQLGGHINVLLALFVRRATAIVLRKMTTDEQMNEQEHSLAQKAREEMVSIKELSINEGPETEKWHEAVSLGYKIDNDFTEAQRYNLEGNKLKAAQAIARANRDFAKIFEVTQHLSDIQSSLQKENQEYFEKYDRELKLVIQLSVLASVLLASCLTAYFNTSTSKRLQMLMSNTTAVAAGEPPIDHVPGADELAQIDEIFHQMYQDLTVLRQKERAILDNASEVICSLDKDMRLTDINDASNKLWGLTADQLIGKRFLELVHDQEKTSVRAILLQSIQDKSASRFEANIIRADGSLSETAWSATWSDEQSSLYCVVSDISARKQLERMKQEFASMISHDLRTPLNSVLASIEIVTSEHFKLDDQVRSYMERAHRNLKLSLSLINQLLEIDKMDAGLISLDLDATSTKEIVSKAVEAVLDLSKAKGVRILVPTSNYELIADSDRLVQVLINLLGNALKFSSDNSTITIEEHQSDTCTRFVVKDEGRGIPIDQQARIFERFQQVNPSDKSEKLGSGLGLSICKGIVEAHHGRIGLTSEPNKGSSFWFEIPRESDT